MSEQIEESDLEELAAVMEAIDDDIFVEELCEYLGTDRETALRELRECLQKASE